MLYDTFNTFSHIKFDTNSQKSFLSVLRGFSMDINTKTFGVSWENLTYLYYYVFNLRKSKRRRNNCLFEVELLG